MASGLELGKNKEQLGTPTKHLRPNQQNYQNCIFGEIYYQNLIPRELVVPQHQLSASSHIKLHNEFTWFGLSIVL